MRARSVALRYGRALARFAAVSEAVTTTIDRYGSALRARDVKAATAQKRAEAGYLPQQNAALGGLKEAAHALANWLRDHGLNRRLSAKEIAHARAMAIALHGVPNSTIRNLKQLGLITGRKQLSHIIAAAFQKAGPPRSTTLAELLGG
jgi:hypothetical protein